MVEYNKDLALNKKRKKRARILLAVSTTTVTAFVLISFLGYTFGRFFANSTTLAFTNKTLGDQGIIEVGFRTNKLLNSEQINTYKLKVDAYDTGGEGYVYWTGDTVSPKLMKFISEHNGYSGTNSVQPVTSKKYVKGQEVILYDEPSPNNYYHIVNPDNDAPLKDYISFTTLFRVANEVSSTSSVGLANYGVYFASDTMFNGANNITKALRFSFESDYLSDILSPGKKTPGSIEVGGRMDLDNDGMFDKALIDSIDPNNQTSDVAYEIAYGEFEEELSDSDWGEVTSETIMRSGEKTFFNANTSKGVRPLENYVASKAYYNPISNYHHKKEHMAVTNEKGIAEIKFNIWLEGWDHDCTNKLNGSSFGAQLKFITDELPQA